MHDWGLVEVFVRVGEAGSMSAATRSLGLSQSTISRRIATLESQLGAPLFLRHRRGLSLTVLGRHLLAEALQIESRLDRWAARRPDAVAGRVRVTAMEQIGAYVLAPTWRELRTAHPDLALDLDITEASVRIEEGDAEIGLRSSQPTSADLVAQHLGSLRLGLYASPSYLEGRPPLAQAGDLAGHDLVGVALSPALAHYLRSLGLRPEALWLRSASFSTRLLALEAGAGIGGVLTTIGDTRPGLTRVLPEVSLPPLPLWLVVHRDQRALPAVQVVRDAILAKLRDLLC